MRLKNLKSSIIILLLIVVSLSATYAYVQISSSSNAATGTGGCFEVNYTGQTISNSELKSTTVYTEGATSNIVLSRNEGCEIYTEASIYLHTNSDGTTADLSDGAMKYKIMQGTTEVTAGTLTGAEKQQLATVPLTETDTTYTIYLWIDSSVSMGAYNGKTYSGYLFASSSQSSIITE